MHTLDCNVVVTFESTFGTHCLNEHNVRYRRQSGGVDDSWISYAFDDYVVDLCASLRTLRVSVLKNGRRYRGFPSSKAECLRFTHLQKEVELKEMGSV